MTSKRHLIPLAIALVSALIATAAQRQDRWTPEQLKELRNLTISGLEKLPADPTNRVADDPRAVELGHRLFFDARLSSNSKVSCATCHQAEREFQASAAVPQRLRSCCMHPATRLKSVPAAHAEGTAGPLYDGSSPSSSPSAFWGRRRSRS